ncbi:sugar-binding domain-containing protein [Bifidobacterium sp. ESL0732]|uniref:sugar-binding transcriptional regulator n=1 Tax=Bifidobacterium sp. ESL0732 TaxID=2983222 RepID=UPI0023F7F18D|nr:sugar-binding domain-containing protein [Bifidobacterium sp. ESL0732]WEV64671.1 hypothetical protein OZX70_03635 [Bifidobacterium sp. ESL0732]
MMEERDISEAIKRDYDIKDVVIVPAMDNELDTASAVGYAAAIKLTDMMQSGFSLTMTWGRIIANIVSKIPPNALENIHITTLSGSIGGSKPELDGPDLARRMALALHGNYEYINAPAIVLTSTLRDQLLSTQQIAQVLKKAALSDVALFGVGTLTDPNSSLNRAGYITKQDQQLYLAQGGVGHIAARIIDKDGQEISEFNDRTVSLPLAEIASIPHRMCVVSGVSKAPALQAALKMHYMNYLVVDSRCATSLLSLS